MKSFLQRAVDESQNSTDTIVVISRSKVSPNRIAEKVWRLLVFFIAVCCPGDDEPCVPGPGAGAGPVEGRLQGPRHGRHLQDAELPRADVRGGAGHVHVRARHSSSHPTAPTALLRHCGHRGKTSVGTPFQLNIQLMRQPGISS